MQNNNRLYRLIFQFMRIGLLPMLLISCLAGTAYSKPVAGQEILDRKVNISADKKEVKAILNELSKLTAVKFVYSSQKIPAHQKVSVTAFAEKLAEVLNRLLTPLGVTYSVSGNQIILVPQQKALVTDRTNNSVTTNAYAADKSEEAYVRLLTGKVLDESGIPVGGVSVTIKGTGRGTTTRQDGSFSIHADPGEVLELSMVGYKNISLKLDDQLSVVVKLEKEVSVLNEVVVVGYGSQNKRNLTGAVDVISGEVLKSRPISNIGQALQGVSPNLTITNFSGQPGSNPSFTIRGFESINGGDPLIVVDGVPLTSNNNLSRINPQDIENITILKDAASAAIYGARAAFGVILITTKSGKYNSGMSVEFSSNFSVKAITRLPQIVTDPYTVAKIKNDGYRAYYGTDLYNQTFFDYAKKRSADPSLAPYYIDPSNPSKYIYVGSTNWFQQLYRPTTPTLDNNLTISGGSDKMKYNVSGGYIRQEGLFKGNSDVWNRYSLRSRIEFKPTKWLRLSNTSQLSRTVYDYPSLWNGPSRGDLYHAIGRIPSFEIPKNPDGSWTESGVIVGYAYDGGRGKSITSDYLTTFEGQVNLLNNNIHLITNYTFQGTNNYNQSQYVPLYFKYANPAQSFQDGISGISDGAGTTGYTVFNAYGEYEKTFAGKHYFKAMAGFGQEEYRTENFSVYRDNLISSNTPSISLALGNPSFGASTQEWALRSLFYRVNYAYSNKYLLEVNGRRDGSSRFPKNDRYAFLPSASVGWRISDEHFFTPLNKVINDMKFRFSYGSLGNQDVSSNYPYIPTLSSSGRIGNILGGVQPPAVYSPGLVSPTLTWEKQITSDWGLDMQLLKNRLAFGFDYYIRDVKDMLTQPRQLPAVLGTGAPLTNAADLRTKGWELSLGWNDLFQVSGSPLHYHFRVVLADNSTVITKYDNPNGNLFKSNGSPEYYVGQKIGEIWGMVSEGLFQSDAEVAKHADQSAIDGYYGFKAGDPKYKDLNGDGKITIGKQTLNDHGDLTIIGNNSPRYTFGFTTSFDWKGFDVNIFLQGVGKRDYWLGSSSYFWSTYRAPWEHVYQHVVDNMWSPANPNAYFPRYASWRTGDIAPWYDLDVVNDRYLQNAAYLRLKNLTIGYTLPDKLLNKIGLKRLRIYLSGENLAEINHIKFKVLDPEVLGGDGSWGTGKAYPFQRSYSAGINVNF